MDNATTSYRALSNLNKQKDRLINTELYCEYVDFRLSDSGIAPDEYAFTASDKEFYDLLAILNPPEALALLEEGVRTESEALKALEQRSSIDLVVRRPELVEELICRGISPEDAAAGIMWTAFNKHQRVVIMEENIYEPIRHADAVELLILLKGKDGGDGYETRQISLRQDVLEGFVTLDTVKELLPIFEKSTQIATVTGAHIMLEGVHRKCSFTLDELKRFAFKARSFHEVTLNRFATAFALNGIEAIEQIDNLGNLQNFIDIWDFENKHKGIIPEGEVECYRLAIQATMYEQELSKIRPLSPSEYQRIMQDAELLHQAGISLNNALPYLDKGTPASKISGVINGMEQGLAEGWL